MMASIVPVVQSNEIMEEADDGSLLPKSQQFASSFSSSNFGQASQEFGLRKTNPFESNQMTIGTGSNGDFSSQQSHHFETTMNDDRNSDSIGQSPFREFGPSVYKMPTMNGGGDNDQQQQSFGQGDGGSTSNQETGSFTPVSLSVEEAFRKYFPSSSTAKDAQDGTFGQHSQGQSNGYPNGANNQQVFI